MIGVEPFVSSLETLPNILQFQRSSLRERTAAAEYGASKIDPLSALLSAKRWCVTIDLRRGSHRHPIGAMVLTRIFLGIGRGRHLVRKPKKARLLPNWLASH